MFEEKQIDQVRYAKKWNLIHLLPFSLPLLLSQFISKNTNHTSDFVGFWMHPKNKGGLFKKSIVLLWDTLHCCE